MAIIERVDTHHAGVATKRGSTVTIIIMIISIFFSVLHGVQKINKGWYSCAK